jgi:hypothetical protein
MNIKSNNKPLWSKIIIIFVIVLQVLTVLPIQTASASTEGFTAPGTFSNSTLANPGNAFASDDQYAQSSLTNSGNNKKSVEYGNFGFVIPADATINLIEVRIEGHGTKNWSVAVSKNNGTSYSAYTTLINTVSDTTTVTSGTGTLWGLTGWTADSLTNANFRVKVISGGGNSANIAYLDQLMVRVVYTPTSAAATTLVITAPPTGTYGGSVNLTATLTSSGVPLPDQQITFSLDGFSRGTAVTNASGVATLSNVGLITGLAGTLLNAGHYVNGIRATFLGDANYAYSTDTELLKINPRPITVTAAPQTKVYGSVDPTLTYQITSGSLVGSDAFSGALARTAGEDVGTHAITQGSLALNANYAITYISNNLTITPLDLIITADNKSAHTNASDPIFTFSTSRFVGSDTFITSPLCSVPEEPHTAEGTYSIICSGADAGSNYIISYFNGILIVTDKIILTVTADDTTNTYGDADPSFAFAYSGFVDGDTQSVIDTPPTCGVAVPHTNVGSYSAITCSGGSDDKYAFSYISGTLTVTPRAITVKADPKTKTYGATDPVLTSQVINGSLAYTDTFSGALSRAAGENVGIYAITQGTLTLGANYLMTYVSDSLTINKATLTVTADDQTIGLGTASPVFTFEYDGFVNGETSSVINTLPTCGVSGPHTGLGTYPIVCSGGSDNNYLFSYVNGTLMILPMISGNVGVGGATLSYVNNGPKSVIANGSGNYAILVPYGWSGTVTPSLGGDAFCPGSKTYTNVTANLTSQHYAHSACPQFDPMSQWTTDYSYNAQQWRVQYHPRLTGDVDGDGDDDIVGFGYDRVLVALSNGTNGFASMTQWTTDYSYNAQQWRTEYHPRLLGDVNGDGKADIVGFGYDRVLVALSTGTSFAPMTQWTTDFSYNAQQWRVQYHPRVLGDVDGDGDDDIIGFGYDRVLVALSNGTNGFAPMTQWTTDFSYNAQQWRTEYHPRLVGDVNGDGKADIVGFGYDRVLVALSTGTSFAPMTQWTTDFSYNAQQWRVQYHPRLLADVNGDGKDDILGFGFDRVLVALSNGSGFASMVQATTDYSYNLQQWRVEFHPRLTGDFNGDGRDDLIGFGYDRVLVATAK